MTLTHPTSSATAVCPLDLLDVERGAAALVGDRQIALFRLADGTVHAIDNRDPATGANVLARGLLGTIDGDWYVASPLHKHRYRLTDGHCLTDGSLSVTVHTVTVTVVDGAVVVALADGADAETNRS